MLGGAVAFWSIPNPRWFTAGWVMGVTGIVLSLLGGGRRFVPRSPREVLATARAAGVPAWPVTVLIFGLFAAGIAGMLTSIMDIATA